MYHMFKLEKLQFSRILWLYDVIGGPCGGSNEPQMGQRKVSDLPPVKIIDQHLISYPTIYNMLECENLQYSRILWFYDVMGGLRGGVKWPPMDPKFFLATFYNICAQKKKTQTKTQKSWNLKHPIGQADMQ